MFSNFSTTTHGKWILTGEHAVLRGHSALVFPLLDKTLDFEYTNTDKPLTISADYLGNYHAEISTIIGQVVDKALELLNIRDQQFTGIIKVNNNIATGLGMGSSAALCIAITRWLANTNWISDHYLFAKTLENFFHGQSSGLDIAGVEAGKPIYFQNGQYSEINQKWHPNWQLSSCGETSTTAKCIAKVQELWSSNKIKAQKIDAQMQTSTEMAKSALEADDSNRFNLLINAINTANDCFNQWGLISETMQNHMQDLLNQGAKAVKPTGSGGGGLVVSLWGG